MAEQGSNGPKLSWTAAAQPRTESKQITEGFETYENFTISNIGDWTLIDADGTAVWGVEEGVYANMGTAQAFTIMNPKAVEPAMNDTWSPKQGQKMAVAFASSRGTSDNWLVTPELSGEKQTLTVWMKSSSSRYLEKVQPVISAVSPEPEEFLGLSTSITVPNEWTQYSYELPAGTKYFALRHVTPSENGFALFVDDFTFVPDTLGKQDITLKGYNVYRDGKLITSAPVSATTYVDSAAHEAEHTYTVTALYDKGESAYSNPVTLLVTNGIEEVSADALNGSAGDIYDLQGRRVQSPKRGIYIMGGRKVLVK